MTAMKSIESSFPVTYVLTKNEYPNWSLKVSMSLYFHFISVVAVTVA